MSDNSLVLVNYSRLVTVAGKKIPFYLYMHSNWASRDMFFHIYFWSVLLRASRLRGEIWVSPILVDPRISVQVIHFELEAHHSPI